MLFIIAEAILLSATLSADAFAAGFAYGGNGIKVGLQKAVIINVICSAVLGISLFAGAAAKAFLPSGFAIGFSFTILFIIGLAKLFDSFTKTLIRRYSGIKKEVRFQLFNFKFILNMYANPEAADADASKSLSTTEAASLALALSLDGLAVGVGAAIGSFNVWAVLAASFAVGLGALLTGCKLGAKLYARRLNLNWLGGLILIGLAFYKIL